MRFTTALTAAASLACAHVAQAAHGDNAEGTVMGPVAFLWPDDRKWDAADDNIGPCGSSDGPGNRTQFPLDQGSVSLSIADEAYFVAFYVAFGNYPTSQVQFSKQVVHNVTEIKPGHQCYKLDDFPDDVVAGSNATIQMQYWAEYAGENDGKNQTFYACADVTFVKVEDFTLNPPCFNVTAADFGSVATSATPATATATSKSGSSAAASTATSTSGTTVSKSSGGGGLSAGAKAGIAVGSIVGGAAIIGLAVFLYLRNRRVGYMERRNRAGLNDPIPLAKRSVGGSSINSQPQH